MKIEDTDPLLQFKYSDAGGGDFYHYDGVPFTGTIIYRDSNGNIDLERTFVEGSVCGVVRGYHPNGQLCGERYEKRNKDYGFSRRWDENGNLIFEVDCGPEP